MAARPLFLRRFGHTEGHTEPQSMPGALDEGRLDSTEGAAVIDTTRRFSRTMHGVDAAFPMDAEYAQTLTRPNRLERDWSLVNRFTAAVGIGLVVVLLARWL